MLGALLWNDGCVCVCVSHIRHMSSSLTHLLMWVTLSLQAHFIQFPPYSLWHGTVLHLLSGVMRQTDQTDRGRRAHSGVKLTAVLNYRTWCDDTINTVHYWAFFCLPLPPQTIMYSTVFKRGLFSKYSLQLFIISPIFAVLFYIPNTHTLVSQFFHTCLA